jgi:3-acetyloctanal aminotransferase
MKFAFLVHHTDPALERLWRSAPPGELRRHWGGTDLMAFSAFLQHAMTAGTAAGGNGRLPHVEVADRMPNLCSPTGARAEGRIYVVPLLPEEILANPRQALGFMGEAVDQAAEWGARLVGLGALTGVVGGRGAQMARRGPLPVTTGNCLTVHAALENLAATLADLDLDLAGETVAVVGIPGSIASAVATLLRSRCRELLLVARQPSEPASQLARQLGAELFLEVPPAVARARVVLSATSSGNCIDQAWLRPGTVVLDVAVPRDVRGTGPERDDVLILTGGLARLPEGLGADSDFVWFHHGVVPCCFAETVVLALEDRAESWSLGRELAPERIAEVGALAGPHGLDYGVLVSFGRPLDDSALTRFRKFLAKHPPAGRPRPSPAEDVARAPRRYARHLNPVWAALGTRGGLVKTFVRGEGAYLWDEHGQRYLDFVSGFGSVGLGHNHPAVVAAVADALTRQAPGFAQSAVNPDAAALAEALAALAPGALEMVTFANSGTEAVEAGLKLARLATGRAGLLACDGSFHGKTLGALSVTHQSHYQRPFGPLLPGCEAVPYGEAEALERALATRRFAAFVVEPLQAEAGMVVPPAGYLRTAQELCRRTGTLLFVDEVQTGLGRTGTLFAAGTEGVEPDLLALAKALGGGLVPIGALLSRRDLWLKAYGTLQTVALHTSTFAGGSLACAAGLAALRVLQDEGLAANAAARGRQLREGIEALVRRCGLVREVRGRGLLLGVEFAPLSAAQLGHWKASNPANVAPWLLAGYDEQLHGFPVVFVVQGLLLNHHVYAQPARSNPRVLRVQPPLTLTEEQADTFLVALAKTVEPLAEWLASFDRSLGGAVLGQAPAPDAGRG